MLDRFMTDRFEGNLKFTYMDGDKPHKQKK